MSTIHNTGQLIDAIEQSIGDLRTDEGKHVAAAWASLYQFYHDVDRSTMEADFGALLPMHEALKVLANAGVEFGEHNYAGQKLLAIDVLPLLERAYPETYSELMTSGPANFDDVDDFEKVLADLATTYVHEVGIKQFCDLPVAGYWIQSDMFVAVNGIIPTALGKAKPRPVARKGLYYRDLSEKHNLTVHAPAVWDGEMRDNVRISLKTFIDNMEDPYKDNGIQSTGQLTVTQVRLVLENHDDQVAVAPHFGLMADSDMQRLGVSGLLRSHEEEDGDDEDDEEEDDELFVPEHLRKVPIAHKLSNWEEDALLNRFAYGTKVSPLAPSGRKKKKPLGKNATYDQRKGYSENTHTLQIQSQTVEVDTNHLLTFTLMIVHNEKCYTPPRMLQADLALSYVQSLYKDLEDEEENDIEDDMCIADDEDDEEDDE